MPCLLLTIMIRFTCGDTKILSNIKISQNIMAGIVAVVLAILAKFVIILKLRLRSISKRITSLTFLNTYTPPQHALTHIILFVSK